MEEHNRVPPWRKTRRECREVASGMGWRLGSRGRLMNQGNSNLLNVASFVNSVLGSLGTFWLHKDKVLKVISDP